MKKESGFTLIELLVVIAIIGILSAIAVPQFAAYRTRAFNSQAESALRNGVTAQEATYAAVARTADPTYITCSGAACVCPGGPAADPRDCAAASQLYGFTWTENSEAVMDFTDATDTYTGTASHPRGAPGCTFTVDSAVGNGIVATDEC